MNGYHIPVLLKESVDGLNISPSGTYVDVTFGGGGHSSEILKKLDTGRLFAFDQDEDAAGNIPTHAGFTFIQGNFRFIRNYMRYYGVEHIDGLLADLGVSSHHFNSAERGFTYRSDASLDMRMNRNSRLTAEIVINEYEESALVSIFREFGELFQARKIASMLVHARAKQRIMSVNQLIDVISPVIPRQTENQFLSKLFQAIRIEVNQELQSLEEMLSGAAELLNPKGRLVVISYHSLEDRLVKNFMRWGNTKEEPEKDLFGNKSEPFTAVTRKPVVPTEAEILSNSRARSARLRIAEKK
ncbi:MAG TPA: 16S rRNA (cytosine(1402)-N(4))-methyltransferase RsmH [Bacteroidales bacterium]|nr:16S rRNA (cytosine(1402)-N(4))-methyltransferase RsmH [Bacteroidales bacterium]